MREVKMYKAILSAAAAAMIFSACSIKNNEQVVHNERAKELLKDSDTYTLTDKISERRNVIDYVFVYPNERLSIALKDLGKPYEQ